MADVAQLAEHLVVAQRAVGSSPIRVAKKRYRNRAVFSFAAIAQSVECILGKDEVTSSNLVSSSMKNA